MYCFSYNRMSAIVDILKLKRHKSDITNKWECIKVDIRMHCILVSEATQHKKFTFFRKQENFFNVIVSL